MTINEKLIARKDLYDYVNEVDSIAREIKDAIEIKALENIKRNIIEDWAEDSNSTFILDSSTKDLVRYLVTLYGCNILTEKEYEKALERLIKKKTVKVW